MKRFLFSFFLSFLFVLIWLFTPYFLNQLDLVSFEKGQFLISPLRIPQYFYTEKLGIDPFKQTFPSIVIILLMFFNVVFYGFIFFFIITISSKLRKKEKIKKLDTPPEPPTFR